MILRSVTQHVKNQNWFAVWLDFLIVVVGVFVGIQVSNWDQARKDNALAADYVQRIELDIKDQITQLDGVIDYYSIAYQHAQSAQSAYQQTDESLGKEFIIDLFQASQRINVRIINATYNELLSTGRVVNIKNSQVRNLITSFYHRIGATQQTINETNPYRRLIRLHMDAKIQAKILDNCGDVYLEENESTFIIMLPKQCDVSIDDALLADEISTLKSNQLIRQELKFHLTILRGQLGSLKNALDMASKTLARIEEAQG